MTNSTENNFKISKESIAVIDFGEYMAGDVSAFNKVVAEVKLASEHLGFFFINNHGVSQSLIDRMFEQTERFHALPLEKKMEVKALTTSIGYLPLGGQTQKSYAALYGESKHPDRSASFYIRREYGLEHPDRLANKPWALDNHWPKNLEGFRETAQEYLAALTRVARRILVLHAAALGLPPDYLAEHDAFRDGNHTLRLLNYPAADPALEGQFGIGPHSDYGYGSILAQSKLPGLEIITRSGEWVQAPVIEGCLLFNNGDMCQRWTNDKFRSAPHRVINRTGKERHSIPLFLNPREDIRFDCFPGLSDEKNPPKYKPQSFGEALAERKNNYKLPTS
jgi:isopenicillin N synthase-like dioxygenase